MACVELAEFGRERRECHGGACDAHKRPVGVPHRDGLRGVSVAIQGCGRTEEAVPILGEVQLARPGTARPAVHVDAIHRQQANALTRAKVGAGAQADEAAAGSDKLANDTKTLRTQSRGIVGCEAAGNAQARVPIQAASEQRRECDV